ncbi:helix-turn-helix domain-containing protein [Geodermatophilus marinus]|uniref:helix-turn-helix domain-containing protein n=1 Tax=Geodermatophilus sp. LHW52908 TaxID=2303986 RepID=UPI000E3C7957|nr:helix-turn-helix domain-containing protein [Geodermatophilus sp. LHW52908]RFU20740.1 AraC family transcriptional regulator [Geodermatophilus sp. LHW52908]
MTPRPDGTRGILHPAAIPDVFTLDRRPPTPATADLVAVFWQVRWDLPPGVVHESLVLSFPAVNLSVEPDGVWVTGPVSGTYRRPLRGAATVRAVRFRAAGFRRLVEGPVSRLRDRVVPAADLLPVPADLAERVRTAADPQEAQRVLDEWLGGLPRRCASGCEDAEAAVALVEADRTLTRVDRLAERTGYGVRALQRLFTDQVGLPVKLVVRHARLREVAERALTGDVDWAAVAAELGYSDQAHLVRDFTAAVGTPPARYARRSRSSKTAGGRTP